jgi:hypothetical protein
MTQEFYNKVVELGKRDFNPDGTLSVLKSNMSIFWSWGVSKLFRVQNKEERYVGLLLKVSGHHHKGWVLITLSWDDTYTVHIINNVGRVLDTFETVYFDDLVEVIDNRIEKIEDYKF